MARQPQPEPAEEQHESGAGESGERFVGVAAGQLVGERHQQQQAGDQHAQLRDQQFAAGADFQQDLVGPIAQGVGEVFEGFAQRAHAAEDSL